MATLVNKINISPDPSIEISVSQYTLVSADSFTYTHGLPERPRLVDTYIKNITAELGYNVGDEVKISNTPVCTVAVNNMNISVALVGLPTVVNPTTHAAVAVTAANWNLLIKAEV